MKIISYNVNGIRAAIKKDLLNWVKTEDPDIFCVQESKSQEDQVDSALFEDLGYQASWFSAEKKGYSGVITFSKKKPKKVVAGIGQEKYDLEGRVLRTDFGPISVLNCYFPSGSSGEERHAYKVDFLNDFYPWVKELKKTRKKLIILGDYNIVRLDIDIHNPKRKDKPSGFRPEEREWLKEWFDKDFKDAFRVMHPEKENDFSWWSYRSGARKNNKGWRIDYISVSNNLAKKVVAARHGKEAVHSDHAPVIVEIDI